MIDIGANLTHQSFDEDLEQMLERARGAGLAKIIVTGTDEKENAKAAALASRYPDFLHATAGLHPHLAKDFSPGFADALKRQLGHPQVVAIGEMGLDFYRNLTPPDQQERALEAMLDIAEQTQKPLFLHERDAAGRMRDILRPRRDKLADIVIHCFTGDREALVAYLDMDLHIGLTGWICDGKRGAHLRGLVPLIPAGRLMLETDSPYILPRDLNRTQKREYGVRGRRNQPALLRHIAEVVASHRNTSTEELIQETTQTALAFFRIQA